MYLSLIKMPADTLATTTFPCISLQLLSCV